MNQHLAYFNTGERENAIEGWGYIDERISTLLGPQVFDKELNQMTTRYCPHFLENFGEKISRK